MPDPVISPGSLVLYKARPALVTGIADKIEIALEHDKSKRVRAKDVTLLHPGPTPGLSGLDAGEPELAEVWELLAGEHATLAELADLLFGDYTPASAWTTWRIVDDGLYFEGTPELIKARSADEVEASRTERAARATAERERAEFLQHVEAGQLEPEDRKRLAEVERVALGKAAASPILAHFDVQQNAMHAHRFLIKCGYWDAEHNPHPQRLGVALDTPKLPLPTLPDEARRDLTHLPAFAIDDEGNQDPDDAISIDGDRLWVHVADAAALVVPDSEPDQVARARGANLYLPEGLVGMLPDEATRRLGLGLAAESPALSFGLRLGNDGVIDIEIVPSRVRVIRTTYAAVEKQLNEPPFTAIREMTETFRAQRIARGATELTLPEVNINIADGDIVIRPMERLASRQMVTDAMLMAGEAAARFAQAESVTIPHAVQAPPEQRREPVSLSDMYAYRRFFKPSQASSIPGSHFGLGMDAYARATSPLRRYLDLVTHQQLRNKVIGAEPLSAEMIAERIGASEAVSGLIRKTERFANLHWKLVWLMRNSQWRGAATIVALEERKAVVMIPSLAMETRIRLKEGMQLDQQVRLGIREVDVTDQSAVFKLLN